MPCKHDHSKPPTLTRSKSSLQSSVCKTAETGPGVGWRGKKRKGGLDSSKSRQQHNLSPHTGCLQDQCGDARLVAAAREPHKGRREILLWQKPELERESTSDPHAQGLPPASPPQAPSPAQAHPAIKQAHNPRSLFPAGPHSFASLWIHLCGAGGAINLLSVRLKKHTQQQGRKGGQDRTRLCSYRECAPPATLPWP